MANLSPTTIANLERLRDRLAERVSSLDRSAERARREIAAIETVLAAVPKRRAPSPRVRHE